jgi:predicted LPLAT superfamily acyltransferase
MSKTPKARRLAGALTPFRVSMTPMGPVRLSLGRTRERLFLSALLDALTTGVERALASSLGGQLLASLLVCIAVSQLCLRCL